MQDRKLSYKTPPASIRDPSTSQEARRKKALEEQKRRRSERFDSSRQLDFFADMTLGPSDDEDDDGAEPIREGISQFATLLPEPSVSAPVVTQDALMHEDQHSTQKALPTVISGVKKGKSKRKGKSRGTGRAQSSKPKSKWADKCMYAELLEMTEDTTMTEFGDASCDGIPTDIESGWVAVAPVPVGKRCLAITHAPSGIAGVVPNTTLRSRVLGKPLMKPFPSSLPPHTVLDCILDEHWKDNGILHILDVIRWKGQDIGDCDTPFRFWWRDTRMSELRVFPPPSAPSQQYEQPPAQSYQFQYPATLVCVPYHTDLSIPNLSNVLVALSRSEQHIPIDVPVQSQNHEAMNIEQATPTTDVALAREVAKVSSDGLLLYVAQSTYEPGTSPLSLWVPVKAYTDGNLTTSASTPYASEGPLDIFERLLRRRLRSAETAQTTLS